jgi:LuxR family maltose regulon positive regulatory protein
VGEAEQLIQQASGGGRDLAADELFGDIMVSLATAKILDGRADTAAATAAARAAVALTRRLGGVLEVANALLAQAQILRHAGDLQAARAAISEARTILRRSADAGPARRLLATADLTAAQPQSHHQDRQIPAEELTAKELDLLRLLASRLSRREIGEHLYVSVNTVKTHQRAIYRKLGIADRAAAVQRGKELGIL